MALKLGKCRLCLKLGDFYSIFTVDNSVQLAEMVMECSNVKVYDGDGLPDKVCSECIQKLSSAYIFKQQCERSDQELRRNYVPPPGFSVSPTPNRQSSDSAFSSHTDFSNQTKPLSSNEKKVTPAIRNRKRSRESDVISVASHSRESSYRSNIPKYTDSSNKKAEKRPRLESESDFEDTSISHFSADAGSDSDVPILSANKFPCDMCGKSFNSLKSLSQHKRIHTKTSKNLGENAVVDIPKSNSQDATDDDDKLTCDKCGKTFKLKIMLKRHYDTCVKPSPTKTPQKELIVTLEPITPEKRMSCSMCTTMFKNIENLEKHMRVCHAAVLKKVDQKVDHKVETRVEKVPVPCIFCHKPFEDYYVHAVHLNRCPKQVELPSWECPVCQKVCSKKNNYFKHIKDTHFEPRSDQKFFECRMCSKKMQSQELLIKHLAAHVSNIEDTGSIEEEDRASTADDSISINSGNSGSTMNGPLKCKYCGKGFTYKKSLDSHEAKHESGEIETKHEPPEPPDQNLSTSGRERRSIYKDTESEDSGDDGDNTCDLCEKIFSYKRALLHHKRTKHNMSSGHKRANINLKDCQVTCLICDLQMKVSEHKQHNQQHIDNNIKPRNKYTCIECGEISKSLQALGTHIKMVHRLKKAVTKKLFVPNMADFCEVVVTKTEPLDEIQSHNGFGEVPAAAGSEAAALASVSGFTCPICSKKMGTMLSLKRHVNWHTNVGDKMEQTLECFVCKEIFRFKGHYRTHMSVHMKDPNLDPKFLVCTICNRRSKHLRAAQAHMNFHKQTRFQSNDYKCAICKRVFQVRKVYLSHMAVHYKRGESISNTVYGATDQTGEGANACPHCGKVCDSEMSLKHHIIWHKSKTSLYASRHDCHMCAQQFTNKRRLQLHIRTHYEDENGPFKCTVCGVGYTDEDYFRRHVKGHNFDNQSHKKRIAKLRENKVKCPICERYYQDLPKLIRHLRHTHPQSKMIKTDPDAPPEPVHSCKLCAKVFLNEKRLQMHEERHLRKPQHYKCKFCGRKSGSIKLHNLHIKQRHLTRKYLDNPLKCTQCEERFVRGYELHHHLRDAHGIEETWLADRDQEALEGPLKELQCSLCHKVLASKGNYARHLDYHNTLRCNYCFEYFNTQKFLEGHQVFACEKRKLIGDTEPHVRKIKCHICYKAFHVQVKLDCHLRAQHDIKVCREASAAKQEFVCDFCFRVFENEDSLVSHKFYHRTVSYFGCLYCDRKFSTETVYRKHKNAHFSQLNVDNPTKCEHCDQTFVAFREMIYHMRDDHGDDKDWIVLPKESIEEECHICKKTFFNVQRHLQLHEDNRCKKCGEYFFSRIDYDNHLCAIETDDEPEDNELDLRPKYEECAFCFKPITKANSKLKHDLIHKNSGSISCRFCTLKFKTIDAFNIHAFTHRNSKYNKRPIKCRQCGEKFVKYGLFIKHMQGIHKSKNKMHYRAVVKPERCVICGDDFPNLHNHYRAHLQHRCQQCGKYFTSNKVYTQHKCDKEDSDPSKVFVSDENLIHLINTYVPKDGTDNEKYYGMDEDEEEEVVDESRARGIKGISDGLRTYERKRKSVSGDLAKVETGSGNGTLSQDDDSQQSMEMEHLVPLSIQSPIISDVLSLYQEKKAQENNPNEGVIIDLSDDEVDVNATSYEIVTIDD